MKLRYISADNASVKNSLFWQGQPTSVEQSTNVVSSLLADLAQPLYVINHQGSVSLVKEGTLSQKSDQHSFECLGVLNPVLPSQFGAPSFLAEYNVKAAYYAGAMANGINSEDMVIALARHGLLSSFGAGGLSTARVAKAISTIKSQLDGQTYAINLLHNPGDPNWEMDCVQLFIDNEINVVEASAYIRLTPAIVRYRLAGLVKNADGSISATNRIIAKVSRPEVAKQFVSPAPEKVIKKLLKQGLVTQEQVDMAQYVPLADDVTVEADSGGHTDHGVLTCIFNDIVSLRDELKETFGLKQTVRIGAAGGLGTPEAVMAAYALGADFVVTGSVNQACIEAGTSDAVKKLLCEATVAGVASAPSADMFEIGAKVQVLKSSSMYAVRAQKLYTLYKQHDSLSAIPERDIEQLEKQIFLKPLEQVWDETKAFFESRGLASLAATGDKNPKKKMALVFQWYLGQSSKWAIDGDESRKADYQVWCGPAMGACNAWLKGSHLESQRSCVDMGLNLLVGAAYLSRLNALKQLGVLIPVSLLTFKPDEQQNLLSLLNQDEKIKRFEYEEAAPTESLNQSASNPENKGEHTMTTEKTQHDKMRLDLTKSKEYYKKTWDLLPGGSHYNFADPERSLVIPFNKGRGSRVWDLDGNEHLDLFCKFGALFVGHHNQKYNESLMKYMNKVTSVDTCDLEFEVCETLTEHIPCAEMVRFGLSGTEAVQNALRLARAYTAKNRFIRFHGHYHGNADNVMGGRKRKDMSWPTPETFKGDMMGTLGRADNILEDQSFILPWNDIEALESVLTAHGDQIAAVLMEPICMNGGGILPKPGYLEKAKALCEKNNVVLIFDEIITGIRLGLGGAQKILGVTPHLSTFAKALGGGSMPISAIAGHKDLMSLYTKGKVVHAGTFNGYPLGLAAIKATYEIVENDLGCYDRMGNIMGKICQSFIGAAKNVGLPMIVQGMPTALVYHSQEHIVDRSEGYTDRVKFCDIIIREVAKRYGLQFSPLSRLYPNLMINDDDVTFFESRIHDVMANAKQLIDLTFKEEAIA
ncbi:MAG: trans-AT polyketide synthase/acyltransferase/oxidoreductase domain-containing protein [Alteromonadaceae bacterium]|jgi:trans-AT polyketide synthase/acyltransferase/oxidoreductase domain-containing protein